MRSGDERMRRRRLKTGKGDWDVNGEGGGFIYWGKRSKTFRLFAQITSLFCLNNTRAENSAVLILREVDGSWLWMWMWFVLLSTPASSGVGWGLLRYDVISNHHCAIFEEDSDVHYTSILLLLVDLACVMYIIYTIF